MAAFQGIAPYIAQIEKGFAKKESPKAIADRLGISKKWRTIHRYKLAVWDMKDMVSEAKEIRAVRHEEARDKAVQEIVDTLEVINLGKLRARQLMAIALGDEFIGSDGQARALLHPQASIYRPAGAKMQAEMAKLEMELADRAEVIALTEGHMAANKGYRHGNEEAVNRGIIPGRSWNATG